MSRKNACPEMIAAREADGAKSSQSGFNFVVAACGPPCNPDRRETRPTSGCHRCVEAGAPLRSPDATVAGSCP